MTKQYLLICDDMGKSMLSTMLNNQALQFLEVQGMAVPQGNVNVLVTPVLPPVNPMPIPEGTPEAPVAPAPEAAPAV